jgi:methylthioribulose 1-phosphate dehydratase/enolase-phosphatase E1
VDHPSEILFLTDIIEEATAAREIGIRAVLSIRPGNAPLKTTSADEDIPRVTGFEQVDSIIDGSATPN